MEITTRTVMVLLFALVAVVDLTSGQGLTKCERTGPCSCKTEKGEINLGPLKGDKPPPPLMVKDSDENVFYYNPCKDMTYNKATGSVIQYNQGYWFDAGSNTKMDSTVKDGFATLKYGTVHSITKEQRYSVMKLICDKSTRGILKYVDENPTMTYEFTLTSRYACPGYKDPSSAAALSVGSILLITFFLIIVIYIIAGVLFQAAYRRSQGRERVPNSSFWFGLPGLIKDGARFTFTRGKGSYQKI